MKKLVILVLSILLLNGCNNDDNSSNQQEQIIEGGIISKFQLVNQEIENLTEDTYQGTINGNPITLVRSNENTLSFLVDESFELGESILEISSIDKKIRYTVNNTILQNTVDETLDNLTTNFTNYVDGLGNTNNTPQETYVINSVDNFNNTIQQLSLEDRETIALVYQANKTFFDNLYQTDYTVPQGRMMSPDYSNLSFGSLTRNWAAATIGAGTATWLAVASSANLPAALVLGTAAIVLWQISFDLWSEGYDRTNVIYENFEFDDFISIPTGRTMMTNIEFVTGVAKSIDYNVNSRGVNSSDVNNDNSIISSFFSTLNDFNDVIDNLNGVINIINNIPFTNISLIDNVAIGNSQQQHSDASLDIFNNISFSLDDNNLELTNVSFDNGSINMTITIIDETIVDEFIEASINYSYEDETNSFTGSFPIKVMKENGNSKWYLFDNLELETTISFYCDFQDGKRFKYYVNVVENDDVYSATLYFREIDDIIGFNNTSLSFSNFDDFPSNPGYVADSSDETIGDLDDYTNNNCGCNVYSNSSQFSASIYIDTNSDIVKASFGLFIRGNNFTVCRNQVDDCSECSKIDESFGLLPVFGTYIGTEPPSDL